ncbi:aromatic ring-hydroxylating dioxygenase subunit alpha [Ferrovibrio sp.]|uniref:aromatic ring-hydroxylating dioxygenase subunit alpha n=1 Tax=Ferrovibrio sp. TaxID=1917215 RepID=UPI0025B8F9DE|nr:aromatic ring-hydroxylating dioxygenase subunit alpha [Ferrovibrio sp.]
MNHMMQPLPPAWSDPGSSRIPYWAYTDPAIYQRELERFFYGPHWCYVGLEAEIPQAGDYRMSRIGERQVIVVRDRDGSIHVVENRCAHRGVRFCQQSKGNARSFVCPYHQWTYKLNGDLAGLPFRHGAKQSDGSVHGGMPADFDLKQHGLTKLQVARYGGLIFASFDAAVPSFADYIGPEVMPWLDRIFQGRTLTILGVNRQRIPGNWKLMMENIKDPYHPGLLHTWFVTFGLWRADQRSRMVMDAEGRHAVMISQRNQGGAGSVTEGVTSFKADMVLHDARLLDVVPEPWWNGPSVTMITLFPSLIIQQQVNSLSTRHITPAGPDSFDFTWTHFGFSDDSAEMTQRRLRQANLFGPAGFVSADDGEVIEFSQAGFAQKGDAGATICELDGRDVAPTQHMVTETLIRGMYGYWRRELGL